MHRRQRLGEGHTRIAEGFNHAEQLADNDGGFAL